MNFDKAINVEDFRRLAKRRLPRMAFDFIEGGTYLVEAYRNDSDQRWKVGSCSPPRFVDASPDEVNALRAWKAGLPPKARVFGEVFSPNGGRSLVLAVVYKL